MALDNRSMWIAGLIAGAAMAVLSTIPVINFVNCFLCAWLWLGGAFAVWYYRRSAPGPVTSSQGVVIGAVAGLIGAVIASVLGLILGSAGMAASLASQAQNLGEGGEQFIGLLTGGLGMILGIIFNLIFYVFFGGLGGLLAATLFNRPSSQPQ